MINVCPVAYLFCSSAAEVVRNTVMAILITWYVTSIRSKTQKQFIMTDGIFVRSLILLSSKHFLRFKCFPKLPSYQEVTWGGIFKCPLAYATSSLIREFAYQKNHKFKIKVKRFCTDPNPGNFRYQEKTLHYSSVRRDSNTIGKDLNVDGLGEGF